jgi:hypothetical protein
MACRSDERMARGSPREAQSSAVHSAGSILVNVSIKTVNQPERIGQGKMHAFVWHRNRGVVSKKGKRAEGSMLTDASIGIEGEMRRKRRERQWREAFSQMHPSDWRDRSRETRERGKDSRGSILINGSIGMEVRIERIQRMGKRSILASAYIRMEGRRSGKDSGGSTHQICFH